MPTYFFHIRRGNCLDVSAEGIALPDLEAVRREAALIYSDMARGITGEFDESLDWRIEVTDQSGRIVFRLSLVAESLEDG
jgi:hypothetical protein